MATPRSINGFEKAIADKQAEIEAVTAELTDAALEEEDALYEKKADLEVELGVLEQKLEEFKNKGAKESDTDTDAETETKESDAEPKKESKVSDTEEPTEPEYPETGLVTVLKGGYMVDPFTHIKYKENKYLDVKITGWIISQVKAGIMAIK